MSDKADLKTYRLLFSFSLALFVCFCFLVRVPMPVPAYLATGALLGVGFCRLLLVRLDKEGPLGDVVASRLKVARPPPFLGSRTFHYVLHAVSWSLMWPGILTVEVLKFPFPSLKGDLD